VEGMIVKPLVYDVVVVGAGIAGLTAAAYTSRAGLKVLLCEKEKKTGGLVNSFEHRGFVFDGGIRAIENSGIVAPMLRQLGVQIDFLPSPVSIGIGKDVVRIDSKESLGAYQALLEKHFPDNEHDIANIIREIAKIMGYMDVLYGIDNPLFLDLRSNPEYVLRTILPWALKYALTAPKIAKLKGPVEEHLATLATNQALIDLIAQHFFQKTPASFALSYLSLYLDYRYPRGGTGALAQGLERFVLDHGGEMRRETEITSLDPGRRQVADARGNAYRYKKLVWAADQKALYRIVDLASLTNRKVIEGIQARKEALVGKIGGDSVLTLFLAVDLDSGYFARISSPHFFYTPSTAGLSQIRLGQLRTDDPKIPTGLIDDRPRIEGWLRRYLAHTTYEISLPALRDSALAPEGKTGLIVSSLFDYSLTKHIEALGWYDEFKKLVADHMIQVLDASIYPGLRAAVIDGFTSTPLTLERISGNSEGAITGWAFTNDVMPAVRSLPRVADAVRTPIPDTYQAGQWTYSPSGLPISILTGKLAADRVLKDLA
jgi:phytoene dehydrogenase-like protein